MPRIKPITHTLQEIDVADAAMTVKINRETGGLLMHISYSIRDENSQIAQTDHALVGLSSVDHNSLLAIFKNALGKLMDDQGYER